MLMIATLLCGLVFGAGLLISGMVQPTKVLAFLDIFGAWDPKAGAVRSKFDVIARPQLNHAVQFTGGVLECECAEQLRKFFRARR